MKTVVSASNTTNTNSIVAATTTVVKSEPANTNEVNTFSAPEAAGSVKRPASLDLNKKPRFVAATPLIIDSPDLQNMKALNTPDLEKILLNSTLLQTPQPGVVFPTKSGLVTSEQEAFGKGFEEALHSLHNSNKSQQQQQQQQQQLATTSNNNNTTTVVSNASVGVGSSTVSTTSSTAGTGMSGGSFTYTNIGDTVLPVSIKDEPQNPSTSPPVSPIDMETQEKIKLERKRQRNRVAASKCRKRKLERISKLEDKVKSLKGENVDLGLVVKTLKDHVAQLKQQVIEHIQTGCSIPAIQYNGATSSK